MLAGITKAIYITYQVGFRQESDRFQIKMQNNSRQVTARFRLPNIGQTMKKNLEQLMVEYAADKRVYKQARNRSRFLAIWPEIRDLLDKGWSMASINEVTKAHGLLDLHYDSLRRYIKQQRKTDCQNSKTPTPNIDNVKTVPVRKPEAEAKSEKSVKAEDAAETPPYSTPPRFGRFNREDAEKLF